jgi:hypothetical protein
MGDAYEAEVIVTLKTRVDPEPLFHCAICRLAVYPPMWKADGRSRRLEPFCLSCEQAYGGGHTSGWSGFHRMDARIIRQINAASVYLKCLVHRKKGGWKINE